MLPKTEQFITDTYFNMLSEAGQFSSLNYKRPKLAIVRGGVSVVRFTVLYETVGDVGDLQ